MTKNETQLIVGRAKVTDKVGVTPGAKRTSHRRWILSAAMTALSSVAAWAQTQLAIVFGTITDPSGAVVPGASVTIFNPGSGLKRSALSDTAGEYRFFGLPTGTYSLRLEKPGFQSQTREGVEFASAAEVIINSRLTIGAFSQENDGQHERAGRFTF
jgi:protocatechuate 3,4-dioxygenase beta subunit